MSDMRKVKIRSYSFVRTIENRYNPDQPLRITGVATRGQEVDWDLLDPVDKERADKYDVFFTPEELEAPAGDVVDEEGAIIDTNSVPALTEWIEQDEPTISELLELVGDDKELAQRVLEAENQASGNDPRKGLVDGLTKVISQA